MSVFDQTAVIVLVALLLEVTSMGLTVGLVMDMSSSGVVAARTIAAGQQQAKRHGECLAVRANHGLAPSVIWSSSTRASRADAAIDSA